MIYTKKELLQKGETDYSIRCKVQTKHLFVIEHGVYSDKPKAFVDEIYICKKYPNAILTGLSAFYIYTENKNSNSSNLLFCFPKKQQ